MLYRNDNRHGRDDGPPTFSDRCGQGECSGVQVLTAGDKAGASDVVEFGAQHVFGGNGLRGKRFQPSVEYSIKEFGTAVGQQNQSSA